MRTLQFLFVGAVALMTMLACSNEEESGPNNGTETVYDEAYYAANATISSSDSGFTSTDEGGNIHFKYKGGQVTIFVSCGTVWLVENDNPNTFSTYIKDPYLIVSAEQNLAEKELTGTITLMTAEQRIKFATITITQSAYGVEIIAETNKWNAPAIGELTKKMGVDATTDEWEFENTAGWLTVEKNDDGVCLTAEENREFEERVAEVVLICTDGTKSDTETITVIQDGLAYINLSEESLMFNMNGGEVTVAVESNFDWEYTYDSEWFTATGNEEYSTLTITCDANNTGDDRKCVITITAGDRAVNIAEVKLTIVQGAHASIAVSTNEWHAPAVGELETEITVEATGDWTVGNTADWLTVKKTEIGIDLTVSENSETLERSADVIISCSNGNISASETIKVTQDGAAYITLSEENLLLSNSGSSASVTVESNFEWDYSYDTSAGWLTIEKDEVESSLTITYTANETGSDREVFVTLTAGDRAENLVEAQLSITQSCENIDALILEYTITSRYTTIELPIRDLTSVTIDWGDGSTTTKPSTYQSHTYSSSGIYTVTINGTVRRIRSKWDSAVTVAGKEYLTGVKQWGNTGLTSMDYAFYGCSGLNSLPDGVGPFSDVTTFEYAFYNCSSLEELPEGIFNNCPSVTTFAFCFYGCSGLTSIPSGLFDNCPNVTSFYWCFYRCSGLTSIPSGLFDSCAGVTTFEDCFQSCTGLTAIPSGLFDNCPNVTSFYRCFFECSGLTSIPSGLFDNSPSVTTFSYCFYRCISLTSVSENVFSGCTAATDFSHCFDHCTSLTTVSENVFSGCTAATDFSSCFDYCTSLTTVSENVFSGCTAATNFSSCFAGCSSLKTIPECLFSNCPVATSFSSCFSSCTSLKTIPEGLFSNCPVATSFSYCFNECDALTTIPKGLFSNCPVATNFTDCFSFCHSLTTVSENVFSGCTAATNFTDCFSRCTSLKTIPEGLFSNCPVATSFFDCFSYCTSLKTIPEGLFFNCPVATDFTDCFSVCTSLTTIPEGLFSNCPVATSFSYCFSSCTSLTTIPEGLFSNCPVATNFSRCFNGCDALKTVPVSIFDDTLLVTDFRGTFTGCSSVEGESPYTEVDVEGKKINVHLYQRGDYSEYMGCSTPTGYRSCFANSTFSDIDSIPSNWGGSGN